ncbi:MAG: sterol desaturase family protein [Rhodobacteraceae bacterium]|nr:sterol desaturase family protein [Paracoccaceae bacterium]
MENEILIRVAAFLGLFALFAVIEALVPRRRRVQSRARRWITNIGIVAIDQAALHLMALALPLLAVGAALDARHNGLGLFNLTDWPAWVEIVGAILILDFAIWAQHLIIHKVPLFWRFHRVHHADRDFDVTTALRFHPVEILASMLVKIGVVYLIGPAALAVILFEIILNGTAMFNHANIRLPQALDRVVRLVLVTPDMHRIHHSVHRAEHDSNYGFALSLWDRILGTYVAEPAEGHLDMTIGLKWQDDRPARLGWILALPFRRK